MKGYIAAVVCAVATLASASAQHFELALDGPSPAEFLTLTSGNSIDAPRRATALERAVRAIEQQIDNKRAADAARFPLQPLWEARFWSSPLMKFIPIPLGPQKFAEDPFVTPAYLTIAGLQSEYQLRVSDQRGRSLFSQ